MTEDFTDNYSKIELSKDHHMQIPWYDLIDDDNDKVITAALKERASIVGRVGIMLLSCGTGAWRVREAMNNIARNLSLTCSADIGLTSISFTCFYKNHSYSEVLTLSKSGVDTDKLDALERFVRNFSENVHQMSTRDIHKELDKIQKMPGNYSAVITGLAAGLACSAFVFLLGGGSIEMVCCFFGAAIGNWIRTKLLQKRLTLIATVALGVASACLVYLLMFHVLEIIFNISGQHEAGYIGAMLFVIPGFPFITSMLDISKQDLRSGLERLVYALMITTVATLVGWLVALTVHLKPANFLPLNLPPFLMLGLRLIASFCGVFGFSIMFNSPYRMAFLSGIIGAIANTLRLEIVDYSKIPPAAAAFIAALFAGLIASGMNHFNGYPRISLTVPSIVIMVPGLYIYRGMYNIGLNNISVGASWMSRAVLIIMMLPLGLFTARVIMDKRWRRND
ncbi:threonine/serine ThrE exporter family protein [Xylocopilactobacillus apis]|uniref:Membrane protein n=1 Tax=Xylocopilactobacillus apis TaxID=2932183 RepID=A0AAU9CY52_9LACO|nr:threonine/serine exporter family protein [Xylocopilactobacillus apis]BDR56173.1 membrane protein [Xylocopilactobacillus apis]